ncbi:MAG: electron transport complex subunit RsxB [Methylococcales bacterium]|jgi:Na+-translocating ferredoxin:NAD+ oxidoreductase subunit B|nr:electron transport complex subunit RsxB [Methylococcales bacterium]MBT7445186.1 electron transport complex subunit RsxB [Methylococcales bacterium]
MTILFAILILTALGTIFGLILGYSAIRFHVDEDPIVDQIDAILPQTQCGQCGFAGCKPYATAIASDEADINQCPPGGEATIIQLADLLDKEIKPLNEENGIEKPKMVAYIREPECIGCTKCITACPVDCIIGTGKMMHTVYQKECTGCELCVPVCPVDCIDMPIVETTLNNWTWLHPDQQEPTQ